MKLLFTFILLPFSILAGHIEIHYQSDKQFNPEERQHSTYTEWTKYKREVYHQSDNGSVWFRIRMRGKVGETYIVSFPAISIRSAELFTSEGLQGIALSSNFQRFQLNPSTSDAYAYIRVTVLKRSHIPIEVHEISEFRGNQQFSTLFYSGYYTLLFAIFLFTAISYYQYRDKVYLIYMALMVVVNLSRMVAEGTFLSIWNDKMITVYLDQISHPFVVIAGYFFTINYLKINPRGKKILSWVIPVSLTGGILTVLVYPLTAISWFAFTSDLFLLIGSTVTLFVVFMHFRTSTFARIFCFAFSPLIFTTYDVYFLEPLGFKLIQPSHIEYRVGMAFEMTIFTIAIAFRGRVIIKENQQTTQSVMLMNQSMNTKSSSTCRKQTLKELATQEYGLTKQEFSVLQLILQEKTNSEIAEKLFVSLNTVKFHSKNIYRKLEINSRKQIIEKVNPLIQKMPK